MSELRATCCIAIDLVPPTIRLSVYPSTTSALTKYSISFWGYFNPVKILMNEILPTCLLVFSSNCSSKISISCISNCLCLSNNSFLIIPPPQHLVYKILYFFRKLNPLLPPDKTHFTSQFIVSPWKSNHIVSFFKLRSRIYMKIIY